MSKVRFTRPGRLFGHELTEHSAFNAYPLAEEGYFYPSADYEALEAKLARLVEAADIVVSDSDSWNVNAADLIKLKAAIEAATLPK